MVVSSSINFEQEEEGDDADWIPLSPPPVEMKSIEGRPNVIMDGLEGVTETSTSYEDHSDSSSITNSVSTPTNGSSKGTTDYNNNNNNNNNNHKSPRCVTPSEKIVLTTAPNGHSNDASNDDALPPLGGRHPTGHITITGDTPQGSHHRNSDQESSNSNDDDHSNKKTNRNHKADKWPPPNKNPSPTGSQTEIKRFGCYRTVMLSNVPPPQHSWSAIAHQVKRTSNASNDRTNHFLRSRQMQSHSSDDDDDDDDDDEVVFVGDISELPPLPPPDAKLDNMTIGVTKRLAGISIQELYDTCWSEKGTQFYRNWLQSRDNTDVTVQDWEMANNDDQLFLGRWCKEKYTQRRVVTFKYRRTTELHSGCLDAEVQQVQMCRMEGDDRLILSMQIDTRGIPFSDSFQIEVRWVFTRIQNDLLVQVGVVIDFIKPIVLAGKLQSELIHSNSKEQLDVFKSMKKACAARPIQCRDLVSITPKDITPNGLVPSGFTPNGLNLPILLLKFLKLQDPRRFLRSRDESLSSHIGRADERLREISTLLESRHQSSEHREVDAYALSQLETVNQILDQVAAKLRET